MGILNAELDPISFGQVRQALDKRTDLLRRDDSGGEVPPDDVRTGDQRRADALVELITGRRAHTLEPLPDRQVSGKELTQLVVVADLGLLDGSRPDGKCEILGAGPVHPSVLDNLSPDSSVCGIIFGGKGRVLWLGRNQRTGQLGATAGGRGAGQGCVRRDAPVHQRSCTMCGIGTTAAPPILTIPHRTAAPAGEQACQTRRPRCAPLTGVAP